ncbi:hypothetical protein J5X84_38575 [Streptosporangiaceae bacterium NEAU-GS5]|nr:hypothetical protein [Streptosporangiaceae bacterium NEAU-GS5]
MGVPRIFGAVGETAFFLFNRFVWREKVCMADEYPVKLIGSSTGSRCVPNGQEPPEGFVRYPAGKVPMYLGDKWDRRWKDAVFDENGDLVERTDSQR